MTSAGVSYRTPLSPQGRGAWKSTDPSASPELVVQRVLMRPTPWSCFSRISTWIHAHLPHARECHASTEVAVAHQPKVCNPSAEGLLTPPAELAQKIRAGAGIRTLDHRFKRPLL